jgi:hypothetical protein
MKPSRIWIEHCQTASGIKDVFGVPQALDYLIADKFLTFVEAAEYDGGFRSELPAFAAKIKTIFEPRQLDDYFEQALREQPIDWDAVIDEDEDTIEMPILRRPDLRRLVLRMRELVVVEGEEF